MIGQKLAHYRITAAIGAGGMGEVYRATDTRLARDVALKVLPPEMASMPERLDRFRREAKALAALDHPGIVTVYSVEEADGVHFLTMQLAEGKSLDRVIPEAEMPIDRILSIAAALADAIAAAHDKGIIHRDLKPANVMVSEGGRVKVLDFGLARMNITEPAGDSQLSTDLRTRDGVVMGTAAYMSPEQITGRNLDHRTDIFSLGIVLYEMTSGRRPFKGSSSAELASAILRDTPRSLGELRGGVPESFQRAVERCLEKSAANRFSSARELSEALRVSRGASSSMETAVTPRVRPQTGDSGGARAEEGFWVAVLPFRYSGGNADLTALADGLSEQIVTGLSRFAYLHVVARGSTLRFTSEATDIRTAGRELGARYVMEGSLRQAGSLLRVSVQLLETSSGGHLWAETYDRSFKPEDIFPLQDELVPRIVSTVADQHGVLVHGMAEVLRKKPVEQLTPYEAVLSVFGFHERMSPEEHAVLRDVLERVVRDHPDQGNCWAMLETLYCDEYMFGFNPRPDPLGRALAAAQRAVEAAPTSNLACQALAQALFFRHEFAAFRPLAERTIALNPMDGATVAFMGILIACSGDWDRGCEVAEEAMQLNPHFAGWYRLASLFNAYRQHDYRAAVESSVRINIPGYFWTLVMSAAAHGQLGEIAVAQKALQELLSTKPNFPSTVRAELGGWFDDTLVEHVIDGLRMAGLETVESHSLEPSTPAEISGVVRAEEGFWVAVLPFKYSGANADLTALAEGLTEEIVTGLSRFSYLRVIARSSTARYANESHDVRTAGKDLGARYVMEGSLRHAGTKLRLAVQLVDAVSGAHLWAENYERTFSPEAVFELQDDLVPRIVSTVADVHGVLPRSMSGALRSRAPEELSPYEAVLRSFGYSEQLTAEEHAAVRSALERAVQAAPANSDALAMLSTLYADEYKQGFNAKPDPLGRALDTARRAVAAAPSNHLAYHVLAEAHFFRKEFPAFRIAAERALALNPMDGNTTAFIGILLAYAGDWKRGVRLTERAMGLNPNHPGWYRFVFFNDALRREDYREALDVALNFNMPTYFFTHAALAAAYGQLGEPDAARNALKELLAQKPDFHLAAKEELGKWLDPALVDRHLEGLRKAGLEVAG